MLIHVKQEKEIQENGESKEESKEESQQQKLMHVIVKEVEQAVKFKEESFESYIRSGILVETLNQRFEWEYKCASRALELSMGNMLLFAKCPPQKEEEEPPWYTPAKQLDEFCEMT